jgi:hypothetical protein
MPKPPNYKRAFRDIRNGYSEITVSGKPLFLKHISFADQVDLDEIYSYNFELAKERGVPTEQEALLILIEEGRWAKAEERKIDAEKAFIENLNKQKRALYLKSEIDRINKDIDSGQERLNKLLNTRAALLSGTAESYADERVNDFYVIKCLFLDSELTKQAFSEEEFNSIDHEVLTEIINKYNLVYKELREDVIQRIVLDDFFSSYAPFAENSQEFFGKSVCYLTYNQLKLLIFCRFYKNAFQQNQNMPENIRKDPDKIMDYLSANENIKKLKEKAGDKENSAQTLVGATRDDLEYAGVIQKGEKLMSLSKEAKKKGGTLDVEDMMKLLGTN